MGNKNKKSKKKKKVKRVWLPNALITMRHRDAGDNIFRGVQDNTMYNNHVYSRPSADASPPASQPIKTRFRGGDESSKSGGNLSSKTTRVGTKCKRTLAKRCINWK